MQLSSSILTDRLSGQFVFDISGKIDSSLRLSRPCFLTAFTRPQNGCIFVGKFRKNEEIPKMKVHSLFITQGRILEELKEHFDCILTFTDDTDLYEVVNYIHSVFNLYENWLQDMGNLTRNGCTLTELLDRSQMIFSNPLMIHDKNFKFIAYSSILDGSKKLSFLLDQSNPADILSSFMIDKSFRDTFTTQETRIFPAHLTGVRTVYKNLFNHEKLLCRILIPETLRAISESDLHLLDLLSEYVKYLLLQEQPLEESPVRTLNHLLLQMLKDDAVDDYTVSKTLTAYDWTPDCSYFCIKFQINQIDAGNHFSYAIANYLESRIKGCCAFEMDGGIVAFTNLRKAGQKPEEIVHSLTPFIRDQNLKAGISSSSPGFGRCYQFLYRQASIALELGLSQVPYKWIHSFHEVRDAYLLEQCVSELPASMVCCPEILEIYEYDKQHNTDYFHTLKTYLENNLQPVATARQLFIHRTTFLYRIQKITERFHIRLSSPHTRMMYQLSIALLEHTGQFDTLIP